jgi:hypothetical protein
MTPLNILSFGAVPDGKTDNAPLINKLAAAGKAQGQDVFIPAGRFAYSDLIKLDGVSLYGEAGSVLYSLNPLRAAIYVSGKGVRVANLLLTGIAPAQRLPQFEVKRVVMLGASDFLVEDVTVESGAGAGIMMSRASTNGIVRKCIVRNTLADSIHITDRSSYIRIEDNLCEMCGDDGIAVVSSVPQGSAVHHITAQGNTVRLNKSGRGMSVVGGSDIVYRSNFVAENAHAAGILVAYEPTYNTFGCNNVALLRNTVVNCGNLGIGHAAVHITSSATPLNGVQVARNHIHITDARVPVRVAGQVNNCTLDQNAIVAATSMQLVSTPAPVVVPYTDGPVGVE